MLSSNLFPQEKAEAAGKLSMGGAEGAAVYGQSERKGWKKKGTKGNFRGTEPECLGLGGGE